MRIAIDIDSTLHPYWDQLAAVAKRRFGVVLRYEDQDTWAIPLLRREQLAACVAETHREATVMAAIPYPGAVETVRAWHEAGHYIHVTSHRAADAHGHTARWLEQVGLPYDDLHCSFDKVSRCTEIGIDLLVDDSPVNLEHALAAGIAGATLLHPWNRDVCETEDIVCAPDWPALAEALRPMLSDRKRARA